MRTTVDIPDATYRLLKSKAAAEGGSVKQLLLRGSELVLREPSRKAVNRLKSPILNNGDPGSLKLDNDKIDDLIGFPDVNVWIALTLNAHEHHKIAWNWYGSLAPHQALVFCRFTQMGFLRLITTEAVAKHETLAQKSAWDAYDRWTEQGGAIFMNEPLGLDIEFRDLSDQLIAAPKAWTDSYLAAFARSASLNLVTFDKALSKKASQPVLLSASS